jgi:hypothetical protein
VPARMAHPEFKTLIPRRGCYRARQSHWLAAHFTCSLRGHRCYTRHRLGPSPTPYRLGYELNGSERWQVPLSPLWQPSHRHPSAQRLSGLGLLPCAMWHGRPRRYLYRQGRRPPDRSLTSSVVPRGTSFHRSVELECSPIGFHPARFSCGLFPGPSGTRCR